MPVPPSPPVNLDTTKKGWRIDVMPVFLEYAVVSVIPLVGREASALDVVLRSESSERDTKGTPKGDNPTVVPFVTCLARLRMWAQ